MNNIEFWLFIIFCASDTTQSDSFQRQLSFISCKYDSDCFDNSYCIKNINAGNSFGKCRCKDNYILVDRNRTHYECLLTAEGPGSDCIQDIQCQISLGTLGSCNKRDNFCECASGSHLADDDMCYKDVALGELCISNYNCLLDDGSYAYCANGKCTCNIKHHPTEDRKKCIPSIPLGSTCVHGESCIHTYAGCSGGICKCITGYVESGNSSVCLKAAARVGDECEEWIQCAVYLKESSCRNKVCICQSAYHNFGNECVPDAKLGERCSSNKECIWSAELQYSVKCEEGVCVCIEGVSDQTSYGCVVVPEKGGQACIQPPFFLLLLIFVLGYYIFV